MCIRDRYCCAESTLKYVKDHGRGNAACYLDTSREVGVLLTPVSYTHLDVYKRQETTRIYVATSTRQYEKVMNRMRIGLDKITTE